MAQQDKYPEGHWMGMGLGIGIAIGASLGVAMGIAMGNIPIGIAMGPAVGVGIGAGIGAILEAKNKDRIRPLTEEERKTRRRAVGLGIFLFLAGLLFFVYRLLSH